MEIQPSRQHLPDRFGPLSPCIAPGPEGLDRQPIRQHLLPPAAYAAITRDDGIGVLPSVSQASWGEASFGVPGRPSLALVAAPFPAPDASASPPVKWVLPSEKPIRGARARCPVSDRT